MLAQERRRRVDVPKIKMYMMDRRSRDCLLVVTAPDALATMLSHQADWVACPSGPDGMSRGSRLALGDLLPPSFLLRRATTSACALRRRL